jgi:hypothetical protein
VKIKSAFTFSAISLAVLLYLEFTVPAWLYTGHPSDAWARALALVGLVTVFSILTVILGGMLLMRRK